METFKQLATGKARPSGLRMTNIQPVAGPLVWVKWVNGVLLAIGLLMLTSTIGDFIKHESIPSDIVFGVILILPVWMAWKNVNGIHAAVQKFTLTSYVVTILFAALLILICLAASADQTTGSTGQEKLLIVALEGLILIGMVIGAIIGVVRLRRGRLPVVDMSFPDFVRHMGGRSPLAQRARELAAKNPPLGWGLLIVAVIAGVAWDLVSEPYLQKMELSQSSRIDGGVDTIVDAIMLWGRRQFGVAPEKLQEIDKRPPVLGVALLGRMEKQQYEHAGENLFDFSLESRLAEHFSAIGPYVTVEGPEEKPKKGVERELTETERAAIVTRMAQARLILLYVRVSDGPTWELQEIIRQGWLSKTIVLFPPLQKLRYVWIKDKRLKSQALASENRLQSVRAAFAGTAWAPALADVSFSPYLRTLYFHPDGRIDAVAATTQDRGSYQLGVLLAHYFADGAPVGEAVLTGNGLETQPAPLPPAPPAPVPPVPTPPAPAPVVAAPAPSPVQTKPDPAQAGDNVTRTAIVLMVVIVMLGILVAFVTSINHDDASPPAYDDSPASQADASDVTSDVASEAAPADVADGSATMPPASDTSASQDVSSRDSDKSLDDVFSQAQASPSASAAAPAPLDPLRLDVAGQMAALDPGTCSLYRGGQWAKAGEDETFATCAGQVFQAWCATSDPVLFGYFGDHYLKQTNAGLYVAGADKVYVRVSSARGCTG